MREDSDLNKEFEAQFTYRIEPGGKEISLAEPMSFRFGTGDKTLQRFIIVFDNFPPLEQSGIFWLESRVRRKGNKRWVSQRYPIDVHVNRE